MNQTETFIDKIVEDLFTEVGSRSGGRKATWLVMEFRNKLDGPGWCKGAVHDIIKKRLCEALEIEP